MFKDIIIVFGSAIMITMMVGVRGRAAGHPIKKNCHGKYGARFGSEVGGSFCGAGT